MGEISDSGKTQMLTAYNRVTTRPMDWEIPSQDELVQIRSGALTKKQKQFFSDYSTDESDPKIYGPERLRNVKFRHPETGKWIAYRLTMSRLVTRKTSLKNLPEYDTPFMKEGMKFCKNQ